MAWVVVSACSGPTETERESPAPDTVETDPPPAPRVDFDLPVHVTLDGLPVDGAIVTQGSTTRAWLTDANGTVVVAVDADVPGALYIAAAHPEARTWGEYVPAPGGELRIDLVRYDPTDNEAYEFLHPGTPDLNTNTGYCAHCHRTINEAWYGSPHRTSASNPAVHDLYAGAAAAYADASACVARGGTWAEGIGPGTAAPAWRCYLGQGALVALDPACDLAPCDATATSFGGCADCHAPGIDGQLGGRDLHEATGIAYDYGVHCEVCHHVDRIDAAGEAGVAGRLVLLRPSEPSSSPSFGLWQPLMFGPWADVPHVKMGAVPRDHFEDGSLCSGCHELAQAVLVPGASADGARWPSGRLPVHTTYSEWQASAFGQAGVACNACHMPPDPLAGNGQDLGNLLTAEPDVGAGWWRPPGSVRRHSWLGPRQGAMVDLAAALSLQTTIEGSEVVASVTVRNVGCGHALPTGEPLRSVVLLVEARCGDVILPAIGGDAVPDFGGTLDRKVRGDDLSRWPGARVGDVVRVVRRTGWRDYQGPPPFDGALFDAAGKGLPLDEVAGQATIVAKNGDVATFDAPLPDGDVAYRVDGIGLPADGAAITARAGAAGFGFARVLAGADGARMVPHFLAVDVASDNRLMPGAAYTTTHRFASSCASPEVTAVLVHRAFPLDLARERGWTITETVMTLARR